jgi:hypothetical protein
MKSLFTLTLLLTSIAMMDAQPMATQPEYQAFKNHKPFRTNHSEKTRGISYRLLEDSTFSIYNSSGAMQWEGTHTYLYSGNRGTELYKFEQLGYYGVDNDADEVHYSNSGNLIQKTLGKYDVDDKLIELSILNFNTLASTFDSVYKEVYLYNGSIMIEKIQLNFNSATSNWDSTTKFLMTYNTDNQLIEELEKTYITSTLSFRNRARYQFQFSGSLQTEMTFEKFHVPTSSWTLNYQTITAYNSFQKPSTKTDFGIHYYNNSFDSLYQYQYFYNPNQTLDSSYVTQYYTDSLGFHQQPYGSNKLGYNGTDTNFILNTNYSAPNINDPLYRYTFQFDTNKNLSVLSTDVWDSTASVYNIESYTNYYYESYTNSTNIQEQELEIKVQLYPNPVSNTSYISFATMNAKDIKISICDFTGKTQFTTIEKGYKGDHLIKLPTENLTNGLYLVALYIDNQNVSVSKLLKH